MIRLALKMCLFVAAVVLLSACGGKPLPSEWESMEGTWGHPEIYLKIGKDGRINYKRQSGGTKVEVNSFINAYSDTGFTVSILVKSIDFRINKKPYRNEESNATQMVMDGYVLTKSENQSF